MKINSNIKIIVSCEALNTKGDFISFTIINILPIEAIIGMGIVNQEVMIEEMIQDLEYKMDQDTTIIGWQEPICTCYPLNSESSKETEEEDIYLSGTEFSPRLRGLYNLQQGYTAFIL